MERSICLIIALLTCLWACDGDEQGAGNDAEDVSRDATSSDAADAVADQIDGVADELDAATDYCDEEDHGHITPTSDANDADTDSAPVEPEGPISVTATSDGLRVELFADRNIFVLGEPIVLDLVVSNDSEDTLIVGPEFPSPGAGSVIVQWEDPEGGQVQLCPTAFIDSEATFSVLEPEQGISTPLAIYYGGLAVGWGTDICIGGSWDSLPLGSSGLYQVRVIYIAYFGSDPEDEFFDPERRVVIETPFLEVHVAQPTGDDLEVWETLLAPDQFEEPGDHHWEHYRLLSWGSGDHLERGIAVWESTMTDHPDGLFDVYARFLRGQMWARQFLDRPPDPDQALPLLDAALEQLPDDLLTFRRSAAFWKARIPFYQEDIEEGIAAMASLQTELCQDLRNQYLCRQIEDILAAVQE